MGEHGLSKHALRHIQNGELVKLSEDEKDAYYNHECERMGLDPLSRPLSWAEFRGSGKLVLYAERRCGDMLAAKHGVSTEVRDGPCVKTFGPTDVLYCCVRAIMPDGRHVDDVGTLPLNDVANAIMKVVTKATRRATLRLCGWGGLDESELETIPGVRILGAAAEPAEAPPNPNPPLDPGDAMRRRIKLATADKQPGSALIALAKDVERLRDEVVTEAYTDAWISLLKAVPKPALGKAYEAVKRLPLALRQSPKWGEAKDLFEANGLLEREPGEDDDVPVPRDAA